jgi:hypothetical protein
VAEQAAKAVLTQKNQNKYKQKNAKNPKRGFLWIKSGFFRYFW